MGSLLPAILLSLELGQPAAQRWPAGLGQQTPGEVALLAGIALAGGAAIIILLRINRSIRQLRQAASRLAQGDLSQRVAPSGLLPFAELGESLNQMAHQLQDRLAAVVQQRNELGAVLFSMVEGVMALDLEDRILSLNRAAAQLFRIDPQRAIGRPLQEVIRQPSILDFAARTRQTRAAVQEELTLRPVDDPAGRERHLQVQSAILRDAQGRQIGAVLVFHDVTRLRRLEAVRRDFVANVSHEIKTPVSAIKAAVETLLSDPPQDPQEARQILKIAARQADRLAAIVDDLLSLARIEQESGQILAQLEPGSVEQVLRGACETCQALAGQKHIRLVMRCEAGLEARMNAALLEQAVVNLIDNAIKYSPPQTQVTLIGRNGAEEVVIQVEDQGRGIEPEHLPRIFERFYRTDAARSRSLGGTGLGLSIVKHVAQAHGGRVSVQSTPGMGSTFRIHLQRCPLPCDASPPSS